MRTLAPIVEWLPAYRRAWLARDLVACAAAWAHGDAADRYAGAAAG
jgi:hypothetical protein